MERHLCSWHRGGQQCPEPWVVWIDLFGSYRPVCREHAKATCPEHAHRILDEILLRRERERAGENETLCERVARLARQAEKRDTTMALQAYEAGRRVALQEGADEGEAHRRGLLRVWRAARGGSGEEAA